MQGKQILIFDSGVGGLSVFEQIIKKNREMDCIYLFDNAYFPYGELEDAFLIERLTGLLLACVEKHDILLIVIACNSASTVALEALRAHLSIPVVGVVPAIKPAAQLTKNGVIGLLATPATIKRHYTDLLINEFAEDVTVLKIGSTALVKMAEQKLCGIEIQTNTLLAELKPWLNLAVQPDTLVLGCTHFPLLKDEITASFSSNVQLVDSGQAIAKRVEQLLLGIGSGKSRGTYNAYYTQAYSAAKQQEFVALQKCFCKYGFTNLSHYRHHDSSGD